MSKFEGYAADAVAHRDDLLVMTDVHDTSMSASGTTKKVTVAGLGVPWYNVVTMYGAAGDGATDDTAAIQAAVSAALTSGGVVYFPAGNYKITSTITAALANASPFPAVIFAGDGMTATVIKSFVSGVAVDMHSTRSGAPSLNGGSGFRDLCIDGTNAAAGSTGLQAGDFEGLKISHLQVQNFTGTGSTGIHFYNQYNWTEEATVRAFISKCTTGVLYSSNATNGGTNSFGYGVWDFVLYQGFTGNFDGVVVDGTTGAFPYHGFMRLRGNFNSSSTALTSAVLKVINGGQFDAMQMDFALECNTGSGTTSKPTTIIVDAASQMIGCTGRLDFSFGGSAALFTPASIANFANFQFSGLAGGDVNISAAAAYDAMVWTNTGINSQVGHGQGSGGTVTQATSKSTGVTLSKPSGQVTMNSAALAAGAIVSFTLTNTFIAAGDVLILNHVSGGTPGSYSLNARCAAGSAAVDVRNNTAGSLSEAIVIGFALVKGSTT